MVTDDLLRGFLLSAPVKFGTPKINPEFRTPNNRKFENSKK